MSSSHSIPSYTLIDEGAGAFSRTQLLTLTVRRLPPQSLLAHDPDPDDLAEATRSAFLPRPAASHILSRAMVDLETVSRLSNNRVQVEVV